MKQSPFKNPKIVSSEKRKGQIYHKLADGSVAYLGAKTKAAVQREVPVTQQKSEQGMAEYGNRP